MSKIELRKNKESYTLFVDEVKVGCTWVGYTDIVPNKEFMDKKSKSVMGFFIEKDFRSKGYGKILMDMVVESEKKDKTTYLKLGVEKNNIHAIKIYEHSGFKTDGDLYNMHYMWLKL
mgnify:CR=1 FL=1